MTLLNTSITLSLSLMLALLGLDFFRIELVRSRFKSVYHSVFKVVALLSILCILFTGFIGMYQSKKAVPEIAARAGR